MVLLHWWSVYQNNTFLNIVNEVGINNYHHRLVNYKIDLTDRMPFKPLECNELHILLKIQWTNRNGIVVSARNSQIKTGLLYISNLAVYSLMLTWTFVVKITREEKYVFESRDFFVVSQSILAQERPSESLFATRDGLSGPKT